MAALGQAESAKVELRRAGDNSYRIGDYHHPGHPPGKTYPVIRGYADAAADAGLTMAAR